MRDEKEERKKQARSNKQTRQNIHVPPVAWTEGSVISEIIHVHVHVYT